jgi:hypothetical protein
MCREVWLPALWSDKLDDLVTRPSIFLDELIEDVAQKDDRLEAKLAKDGRVRLDRLGDQYAESYDHGNDGICARRPPPQQDLHLPK